MHRGTKSAIMTVGVRDRKQGGDYAMSEENEALVRRYFEEIWDKGNLDLIDELFTTNFVRHGPVGTEGEVRGLEGFKGLVSSYRTGLPDLRIPIEDLTAEGNTVVTRWTAYGTHQGELLGNAPTGNQATVNGILVDRVSGSKIEEEWVAYDTLHFMQQIGGVAAPGK
jgi:predicted ester cyclase